MLEYLYLIGGDETFRFLGTGSPPLYVRLLGLNALFLALYAVRKAVGSRPMSPTLSLFVQAALLGANLLVLYQTEVEEALRTFMNRF